MPLSDDLEKAWRWWRRRAVLDRVSYRAWDRRPAGGPLAPYLGNPHSRDELLNAAFAEVTNPREFSLIRAWPVACLRGATIAGQEADLTPALQDLLMARLPVRDWVAEVPTGPLRKYGLFHTSIPAPTDSRTDQPMALELAGVVTSVAGRPTEGGDWMTEFRQGMGMDEWLDTPIAGDLEIRIDVATYANVGFPGVGVPMYL